MINLININILNKAFFITTILVCSFFYSNKAFCATLIPDINNYTYTNKESSDSVNFIKNSILDKELDNDILNINLSYHPKNPINNQSDLEGGDVVNVYSKVNVKNKEEYLYKWSIEAKVKNKEIDGEDMWIDITDYFNEKGRIGGNGLNNFFFKLNLTKEKIDRIFNYKEEDNHYLRVRLDISRKIDEKNDSEKGREFIEIKILNKTDVFQYSIAKIEPDNKLGFDDENKTCLDKDDMDLCKVIEGEILSIRIINSDKYSNAKWFLNSSEINGEVKCNPSLYLWCEDNSSLDTIFFPVFGINGDILKVSFKAQDLKTGENIILEKNFLLVEPEIKVELFLKEDNLLAENKNSINSSVSVSEGTLQELNLKTTPGWLVNKIKINWIINGNKDEKNKDTQKIIFNAMSDKISPYNIKAEAIYYFSEEKNSILKNSWNILNISSLPIKMESDLKIKVLKNETEIKDPFEDPKAFFWYMLNGFKENDKFLFNLFIIFISLLFLPIIISFFSNNKI